MSLLLVKSRNLWLDVFLLFNIIILETPFTNGDYQLPVRTLDESVPDPFGSMDNSGYDMDERIITLIHWFMD